MESIKEWALANNYPDPTNPTGLQQNAPSNAPEKNEKIGEICERCRCKVEVGMYGVVGNAGHSFILYTLADGRQRFYRGGPTQGSVYAEGQSGVHEHNSRNSTGSGKYSTNETIVGDGLWVKMSKFGPIVTHWGKWTGSLEQNNFNDKKLGITEIVEGADYCNYHNTFVSILKEIASLRIEYEALGPNCHSVTYTILLHSKLPAPKPSRGYSPGWGKDLLSRKK